MTRDACVSCPHPSKSGGDRWGRRGQLRTSTHPAVPTGTRTLGTVGTARPASGAPRSRRPGRVRVRVIDAGLSRGTEGHLQHRGADSVDPHGPGLSRHPLLGLQTSLFAAPQDAGLRQASAPFPSDRGWPARRAPPARPPGRSDTRRAPSPAPLAPARAVHHRPVGSRLHPCPAPVFRDQRGEAAGAVLHQEQAHAF